MGIVIERTQPKWLDKRSYPYESNFLTTDVGRMHYIDVGSGQPILFIHGWPLWSYEFRASIRMLSRQFRCIAPDLMGFGLSDKPQNWKYSPSAQGQLVSQLIRHLDLRNLTLVLHEFGGPVGMSAAFDDLLRIGRIVLMNTWLWDLKDEPGAKPGKIADGSLGKLTYLTMNGGPKAIKSWFCDTGRYSESVHNAYFGPFEQKEDRVGVFETARQYVHGGPWFDELWSQRERLADMPLLLLWGLKDENFGEKALNRFWHEFPLQQVKQVQDCGRCLPEEHPELLAEAITSFIAVPRSGAFVA